MTTTPALNDNLAKDRADWLLDAVACATQDRRFLRGEPEYDDVAGDAILMNGEKAIRVALEAQSKEIEALRSALEPFANLTGSVQQRCFLQLLLCPEGDDDPKNFANDIRRARTALKGA